MDSGKVIKGDYKGKLLGADFSGKKVYLFLKRFAIGKNSQIELNADTVSKVELMSENGASTGASFAKEMVFGTAAAVNSAKNKVLISIEFKDGKKSLVQCDRGLYQALQISCFE